MKTKITLLIIWVSLAFYSQENPNHLQIIDNPNYKNFKELNVNNIPTGILLNYGHSRINVEKFNGTLQDSTYTTKQSVSAIYSTLLSAIMLKKNNANTLNLPKKWHQLRKANTITLGGLLYNYNILEANTIKLGRIQAIDKRTQRAIPPNSRRISSEDIYFKENPNPPVLAKNIPLYKSSYAFAIAPSINNISCSNFTITLPKAVFATNSNIKALYINVADGKGYQKITFNSPIQVNYRQKKTYTWVYKAVLTNGTTLYSHSKVTVNKIANPNTAQKNSSGIIEDGTYVNSGIYKAFLEIHYANNDKRIRKPLIIAEGLDVGYVTSPEKPEGENDLSYFQETSYRMNNGTHNYILHNKLFGNEYDIIYVNWHNGLDYIEHNAEVLKEVIRMVNRAKRANNSTEKNVVLGQSMGGLVARYALKDMEDKNENHDTRLYISHDAPHQGANAPISVQYLVRHMRKIVIRNPLVYTGINSILPFFEHGTTGYDYYNILDNPATRQMMMNWVDKDYQINNNVHTAWQAKLRAKGYPQHTRNVAIANGGVCGDFQNQVGNVILNVNKEFSYHAFQDFITEIIAGQHSRVDLALLANFPGEQKYRLNLNCKPILRNTAGSNIYDGLVSYKKKIFWFIPVTVHLSSKKINQPSGLLPYDELPGSFFNLAENQLPSFLQGGTHNSAAFIPNISALDYGRGNINHNQSVYQDVIYQNNSNIPFQDYILESENSEHITFSNENSQWLVNMLDNQTHTNNDALFCPKDKKILISKNAICKNSEVTIKTNFNAPRFEWKVTRGRYLLKNLSSSMQQNHISFKTTTYATGELSIQLRYGDANFNRVNIIDKTFWVGKPKFEVEKTAKNNYVSLQLKGPLGENINNQEIQNISWKKKSNYGCPVTLAVYSSGGRAVGNCLNWSITADISARNICGTTTVHTYISAPPQLPCENEYTFKNTGGNNHSLRIIIEDPCNQPPSTATVNNAKISAYNIYGNEVKTGKNNSINLSSLKKGIYFLKSNINGKIIKKTVSKN